MYLNERSWEAADISPYVLRNALAEFVKLYGVLAGRYGLSAVYVPAGNEPYLRSVTYTLAKWLSETDREYRRLFLSFWQKRIIYQPEDEYEARCGSVGFLGAAEAILQDSFLISLRCEEKWEKETLCFYFYSLSEDKEVLAEVSNVSAGDQLEREPLRSLLKRMQDIPIYSYGELWDKRKELFPNLAFCPSVERDFQKLETMYLTQVMRKLRELNGYAGSYGGGPFLPERLSKTTPESEETLKQYREEHTFADENGNQHVASWHMRFTGIAGRIFFIPGYRENQILVCYIGRKLPNASYPK